MNTLGIGVPYEHLSREFHYMNTISMGVYMNTIGMKF